MHRLRYLRHLSSPLLAATGVVLLWSRTAHAYMDLGTGSYIFQLLLAGLLGALFALKMYWRSFKNAIRNLFSRNRNAGKRNISED